MSDDLKKRRHSRPDMNARTMTGEPQPGVAFQSPDIITALKIGLVGDQWLDVPLHNNSMKLGRGVECERGRDLRVDDPTISRHHCNVRRTGNDLTITDNESKHGVFFNGTRTTGFRLTAAQSFRIREHVFYAFNKRMREIYPQLTDAFGEAAWAALVDATNTKPMLITSDEGNAEERRMVAGLLHSVSPSRGALEGPGVLTDAPANDHDFFAYIKYQCGGSLIVDVDRARGPYGETLSNKLTSLDYRLMILASDEVDARAALGARAYEKLSPSRLRIQPLTHRKATLLDKLDRIFVELNATIDTDALTEKNRNALMAYSWPGDLAELRVVGRCLAVYAVAGSQQNAADQLGMARSTFQERLWELGIGHPLVTSGRARGARET